VLETISKICTTKLTQVGAAAGGAAKLGIVIGEMLRIENARIPTSDPSPICTTLHAMMYKYNGVHIA